MTSYAEDTAAQQRSRQSAAIVSGAELPEFSVESVENSGILLIQAWSREVRETVDFWQDFLPGDRMDLIELIEANDLFFFADSLHDGLLKYAFGDSAQLRQVDLDAWMGIRKHWGTINPRLEALREELADYFQWISELTASSSEPRDPLARRATIKQRRQDMKRIVVLYAQLASPLRPVLDEIVNFP